MLDTLGTRMKGYEEASRTILPGRLPVVIRVDGKAFHTYVRGLDRPFDERLSDVMALTATKLCEEVQGAQLAYSQSDEISVLVHGYKRFSSSARFDNQVQKIVSVAAGIASATFTALSWHIRREDLSLAENAGPSDPWKRFDAVDQIRPAVFDARAFVVPEADVCNYFLWRQQDAVRNSVQMLARSIFSHKQCDKKSCDDLREMCSKEGKDWNELPLRFQRGFCIRRANEPDGRSSWSLDLAIPIFSDNRSYVNDLLKLEEE